MCHQLHEIDSSNEVQKRTQKENYSPQKVENMKTIHGGFTGYSFHANTFYIVIMYHLKCTT